MMGFGDTANNEVINAVFKKLDPWLQNPPQFDEVTAAYKKRGKLQSDRVRLSHRIEQAEDAVVMVAENPRSNLTRLKKLEATRELKSQLAELDAELAIVDNDIKILEYCRAMFSAANYHTKIAMDL